MKYVLGAVAMSIAIILALPYTSFAGEGEWRYSTVDNAWWYSYNNGVWATSKWQQIKGKWYYFDADGYMMTNSWIGDYYVGKDGAMLESTYTPDGVRVGSNGKRLSAR